MGRNACMSSMARVRANDGAGVGVHESSWQAYLARVPFSLLHAPRVHAKAASVQGCLPVFTHQPA